MSKKATVITITKTIGYILLIFSLHLIVIRIILAFFS